MINNKKNGDNRSEGSHRNQWAQCDLPNFISTYQPEHDLQKSLSSKRAHNKDPLIKEFPLYLHQILQLIPFPQDPSSTLQYFSC